jgi:uncharacterized damage-inducible protein DinB
MHNTAERVQAASRYKFRKTKEEVMTQTATAAVPTVSPMLDELRQESATTRRILDRIPADRLSWKPCEKSLTVGQIAFHLAAIPGVFAKLLVPDTFDVPKDAFTFAHPATKDEILSTFDTGIKAAQEFLAGLTDEQARGLWTTRSEGRTMMQLPRGNAVRMLMLNHSVHHRGQLSIYLREMGVAVPAIYGPSGDENPFAPK